MKQFCRKCHHTWITPPGNASGYYICPECDEKGLRRSHGGKKISVYPPGVTVSLLEGGVS